MLGVARIVDLLDLLDDPRVAEKPHKVHIDRKADHELKCVCGLLYGHRSACAEKGNE